MRKEDQMKARAKKYSGKFIVFEGGEGSGKTTQIAILENELKSAGKEVCVTREPGGNGCLIAEKIRMILKDPANAGLVPEAELFLFCASRAQHVKQVIIPHLTQDIIVVSDRFFGSTLAYQHFGRGLFNLLEIKKINAFATGGLEPNLTILLDIDPTAGLKRIADKLKDDRFDSEILDFHKKVRQGFLTLANTMPNWIVINANDKIEVVRKQIWQHVFKLLCF